MRSSGRGFTTGIVVGLALTFGRAGAAEETRAPWTDRPIRIDRSRETRERLPARSSIDGEDGARTLLRVDTFPRLADDVSFGAEGRRWRLAHVALPERARVCPREVGPGWACGLRAWAEVSAFLAGKRLRCAEVKEVEGAPVPALDCAFRNVSVAETLVAKGWLVPDAGADADLIAAHTRAVAARRGLTATAPP